jgi:hypothetical protein
LAVGVTGAGLPAFTAGAAFAAGTILYVGTAAGSDAGCSSPGYTTVQGAVNAATPGDTVYLCGTTPFREQVIITKSITLSGDSGATIAAPNPWVASADPLPPQFTSDGLLVPQAIVVAWGHGVHVTIQGLTITGPLPGDGGCGSDLYGCQFGVGNHNVITFNHVDGAGYQNHPTCTVAQPYVTYKIDTRGSADPLVLLND